MSWHKKALTMSWHSTAKTDDEQVLIYSTLSEYYKIRSKVVHGGGLSAEQEAKLRDDGPLREIVRRCLRGFMNLAVNPGEWTLTRLERDTDKVLLHTETRTSLQNAMGI